MPKRRTVSISKLSLEHFLSQECCINTPEPDTLLLILFGPINPVFLSAQQNSLSSLLQPEKPHLLFLILITNCWNIKTWTNTVMRKMQAFFLIVVCLSVCLWFELVGPVYLSCSCFFITATILASVDVSVSARNRCQLALKQENELFVSRLRNAELF